MASTTVKNALQSKASGEVKQKSPAYGMQQMMRAMAKEIEAALPSMLSSERFQRVALTAFSANPALQKCDSKSFIAAMMQSAQLGLEPNTPLGQAYLIPYGQNVQFQVGYKGLLELAQRSGKIKTIYAHEVRENDEFDIDYGLEQSLKHKPLLKGDRGDVIGYYAVYHTIDGGFSFVFMTKEEVNEFAQKKSKTFNNGPWKTDFDAMAKKTVIKQLLKYAPISIELQQAIVADTSVKTKIDADMSMVEDESNDYIDTTAEEVVEVNESEIMPGQQTIGK
ncbi:MAG: recombination protein RecT [Clostridiales bacterium]|nr:recombination protein RecT [Clostridiales bacterium]